MTLGVVIPCYRQERFLPRTIRALESALAGLDWHGVLVFSSADGDLGGLGLSAPWQVVRAAGAPGTRPLTPGAARNAGFAACAGAWVLFVDADVELERAWIERAVATIAAADATLAGLWGRIEEWFVDQGRERPGVRDLYRLGDGDADSDYTATLSLYRRSALAHVGGYDARLNSEEDFELGLRLRAAGFRMRALAPLAAKHWSAPRPSFSEYGRRWRTGLCFGSGQALRFYLGRAGAPELLRRNAHYFAVLALAAAAPLAYACGGRGALLAWAVVPAALLVVMTLKKRSLRLALHSLTTWTVMAAGLVVGFVRGGAPGEAPVREVA
ncbi:MAG: glycosyltransferase [Candidatus Eisenbacteria bacterium]